MNTTSARPSTPQRASGGKATIIVNANPIFTFMMRRAALAWAMARGRSRRSVPVSATSAEAIAASVPVAPMAMPTVAAASAGASLIPSPTMAQRPSTNCALSSGRSSAWTSSIPTVVASAFPACLLSPVSIAVRIPIVCSSSIARAEDSRAGSPMPTSPFTASSSATTTTVAPVCSRSCVVCAHFS